MKLKDIGERKAIEEIVKILGEKSDIGDDCAKIDFGEKYLLLTTDMITESTHIPVNSTPWQIGWHIIAINLSDIAAKGGEPLGILISLGLPKDYSDSFLKELTNGMKDCTDTYKTEIIGGDTKENENLTLCGTAIGIVSKNEFIPRIGAKIGDLVAVTGSLGKAAAGYYSLNNKNFEDEINSLKSLLEIKPRIKEGRVLAKTGVVTSCMDISDGLASSIYQLSKMNNVGFEIYFNKVPVSPEVKKLSEKLQVKLEEMVLYFGGDYELLLTIKPSEVKIAVSAIEKIGGTLSIIGKVTEKENFLLLNSNYHKLENRGYEHLR